MKNKDKTDRSWDNSAGLRLEIVAFLPHFCRALLSANGNCNYYDYIYDVDDGDYDDDDDDSDVITSM